MATTANGSTARTGHLGKAVVGGTLVYRLTQWSFTPSTSDSAWGDSDSGGFTVRAAARKDGSGSISGKFDENRKPYSLFMPGDIVKLVLWESATDYWVLTRVLINNLALGFSPDSKEVVDWSADFSCDGAYYYPGQSGASVETLPTT